MLTSSTLLLGSNLSVKSLLVISVSAPMTRKAFTTITLFVPSICAGILLRYTADKCGRIKTQSAGNWDIIKLISVPLQRLDFHCYSSWQTNKHKLEVIHRIGVIQNSVVPNEKSVVQGQRCLDPELHQLRNHRNLSFSCLFGPSAATRLHQMAWTNVLPPLPIKAELHVLKSTASMRLACVALLMASATSVSNCPPSIWSWTYKEHSRTLTVSHECDSNNIGVICPQQRNLQQRKARDKEKARSELNWDQHIRTASMPGQGKIVTNIPWDARSVNYPKSKQNIE